MSTEQNKAIVHRFVQIIESIFRGESVDQLDEVVAPEVVMHINAAPADLAGLKGMLPAFSVAFPDIRFTAVDNLTAENDLVSYRLVWQGTHNGDLMGIAPTGKQVTVIEMHTARLVNGKIVERWGLWDSQGLMQQLGVGA